jgi:hypothetical protein
VTTALTVTAIILGVLALVIALFVRSHLAWRAKQTPAGVWRSDTPDGQLTLQFEGGPHEGTYKQVVERSDGPVREFGHWHHSSGQLQLMIMATDQKDHPEFGVNTLHVIRFVSPTEIAIEGPHRPRLTYSRAPVGVVVAMEPAGV